MKKILVTLVALVATVSVASASGINLSWDECGTTGSFAKTFDCQSNSGPTFNLYASFVPDANEVSFVGVSAEIDISSTSPMPAWWQYGAGSCRGTAALQTKTDFSLVSACQDPYAGASTVVSGNLYTYQSPSPNSSTLVFQGVIPVDEARALDPSTEYYAFWVSLNRTKSIGTGTGVCDGCSQPVCLQLKNIDLFQADNTDTPLTNPINNNIAVWQADTALPGCQGATPTQSRTWGQLKSLYR